MTDGVRCFDQLVCSTNGRDSFGGGGVGSGRDEFVLVTSGESTAFDEGRLAERIMLAAAHGLGASIGMFWGLGQVTAAKTILDIPTDRALRTAISIGYPADNGARLVSAERNRLDPDIRQPLTTLRVGLKPLTHIVHHERYGRRQPARQENACETRGWPDDEDEGSGAGLLPGAATRTVPC